MAATGHMKANRNGGRKGDDSRLEGSTDKAGAAKRRILLLDSYSLAFRAFFALPETLVTSSGQVTNAVFGFTSMLFKLESEERPDAVIACMDKGEPQFRLDQYPAVQGGAERNAPDPAPAVPAHPRGAGGAAPSGGGVGGLRG